jgi:hypothetical protein
MTDKKEAVNQPLEIVVDMSKFMVEDLEILDAVIRGDKPWTAEIDVFERVVVGGVRGKYPAHYIRKIRDEILKNLREASNDPS